jgi:hypothetical protein
VYFLSNCLGCMEIPGSSPVPDDKRQLVVNWHHSTRSKPNNNTVIVIVIFRKHNREIKLNGCLNVQLDNEILIPQLKTLYESRIIHIYSGLHLHMHLFHLSFYGKRG